MAFRIFCRAHTGLHPRLGLLRTRSLVGQLDRAGSPPISLISDPTTPRLDFDPQPMEPRQESVTGIAADL